MTEDGFQKLLFRRLDDQDDHQAQVLDQARQARQGVADLKTQVDALGLRVQVLEGGAERAAKTLEVLAEYAAAGRLLGRVSSGLRGWWPVSAGLACLAGVYHEWLAKLGRILGE